MSTSAKHVLAVSQPMFGHLIPLLELCKKLADNSFHITFAVSEIRLQEIESRGLVPPQYSDRIDFYGLKDGLTNDLESHLGPSHLPDLVVQLRPTVTAFLTTATRKGQTELKCKMPIDFVVYDIMMITPAEVCKQLETPCYAFVPNALYMLAMFGFPDIEEGIDIGTDEDFFLPPPEGDFPKMAPVFAAHIKAMKGSMQLIDGILANSSRAMEGAEVDAMIAGAPALANVSVLAIGPLLQAHQKTSPKNQKTSELVNDFLDQQDPGSTVYISFGSMIFPSITELNEIGKALLSLERPFVWSLRGDQYENLPQEIQTSIPTQTKDSRFLVIPWVDQQAVLAHPSIRVFISHCGWNSLTESLAFGKPIVAWPMFADQHINADFLVGNKLGVKIPGTAIRTLREIQAAEIVATISEVSGWNGNGCEYVEAAKAIGEVVQSAIKPGGTSSLELSNFIERWK